MAERLNGVAHHLRDLLRRGDAIPDAELLARFADARDGEAFAALVSRHGPMVLAVCRRVLRNAADADDAFQATFLVLARRANSVRPRSLLANWLYGVAYRTASEARRAAVTRRAKEGKAASQRDSYVTPPVGQPDLRELLDRELTLLPDVYRTAIVLCDLEGLPRKEAAGRLGWAEGTLSGRLFRARTLLAGRLSKYGLTVSAAALAAVSQQASAAVPAGLTAATARAGVLVAAGEAAAVVASAPVAALTEGVMRAMLLTKLKGMTAGLMVACAVTATGLSGWTTAPVGAQDRPAAGGRSAPRDPDKDRIAQLERERQELLKLVVELRARVAALEAEQKQRNLSAFDPDTGKLVVPNLKAIPGGRVAGITLNPSNTPLAGEGTVLVPSGQPAAESAPSKPGDTTAPGGAPGATGRMAFKLYPVEDLAGDEKQAAAVVRILKAAVDPASWQSGVAVVEYYPQGRTLLVRQTPDGHRQVGEVLDLLRTATTPKGRTAPEGEPIP